MLLKFCMEFKHTTPEVLSKNRYISWTDGLAEFKICEKYTTA